MHPSDKLFQACLRYVSSQHDEPHANYDAELEYCKDMIYEAVKEFVIFMDANNA